MYNFQWGDEDSTGWEKNTKIEIWQDKKFKNYISCFPRYKMSLNK